MLCCEPRSRAGVSKDFWRKRPGASKKSGQRHSVPMCPSRVHRVMFRSLEHISVSLLGPSLVCMLWLGQKTDELEVRSWNWREQKVALVSPREKQHQAQHTDTHSICCQGPQLNFSSLCFFHSQLSLQEAPQCHKTIILSTLLISPFPLRF